MKKVKTIMALASLWISYVIVSSVSGDVNASNIKEKLFCLVSPFIMIAFIILSTLLGILSSICEKLKIKD